MGRLYRPTIPLDVKCRVALRQLGEMFVDDVLAANDRKLGKLLANTLEALADLLKCTVKDLRLDHDPPLGVRQRLQYSGVIKPAYIPDANDPEHLKYRPHGTQFAGSHDVKTRIRGEHGQLSDIALIKKMRRIERGPKPKRGPKIKSRGFPKGKQKMPKRPFRRK